MLENPDVGARNDSVLVPLTPTQHTHIPPAPMWGSGESSDAFFCSLGLSKLTEMLLMTLCFRCGREGSGVVPSAGFMQTAAAQAESHEVDVD